MTAPFTAVQPPQTPYLRPDPLHEDPGPLGALAPLLQHLSGQLQQRQQQSQDLLIKKGQLAIEQEKADAEADQMKQATAEHKQKTQMLQQTGMQLTQALQKANSPEDMLTAMQGSIGNMVTAGDPQQAAEMLKSVASMRMMVQQRQQDQAEDEKIRQIFAANPQALADPKMGRAALQLVAGINPKKAEALKGILPPEPAEKALTTVQTKPGETTRVLDERGQVVNQFTGGPPPAKPEQLNQATLGSAAMKSWLDIEGIRKARPGVEADAGSILAKPTFVNAIPLMKNRGDMVALAQKAGASGDVLQYLRAKFAFIDNIIRTRIQGGRLSGAIYGVYANELMPSVDMTRPEAASQMRDNERQAVISAIGKSGYSDNPDTWNKAAKLRGIKLSPEDFINDNIDTRLDALKKAY